MQTNQKICTLCQKAIYDTQNIELCPECGKPYHKECYEKAGGCINPDCVTNPPTDFSKTDKKVKASLLKICPLCSARMPLDSEYCPDCYAFTKGVRKYTYDPEYKSINYRQKVRVKKCMVFFLAMVILLIGYLLAEFVLIPKISIIRANAYFKKQDYENACIYYEKARTEQNVEELYRFSFSKGMIYLQDERFDRAKKEFENCVQYMDSEEAKEMLLITGIKQAEKKKRDGHMNEAYGLYKTLPENFSYRGIVVKNEIESMESHKDALLLTGVYFPEKLHIRGTHTDSYGKTESKEIDMSFSRNILEIYAIYDSEGNITYTLKTTYSCFGNNEQDNRFFSQNEKSLCREVKGEFPFAQTVRLDKNTTLENEDGRMILHYREKFDKDQKGAYSEYATDIVFGERSRAY